MVLSRIAGRENEEYGVVRCIVMREFVLGVLMVKSDFRIFESWGGNARDLLRALYTLSFPDDSIFDQKEQESSPEKE